MIILANGCATNAPDASSKVPLREVPSLNVVMDCGSCQVRPNVPGLIVEGYTSAAIKSGATVVAGQQATVIIKEYAARDDAARFLVGAFAGKDEIKADVTFESKHFMVEDYYRNAWLGIEALARKIGGMVFEKVQQ